MYSLLRKDIQPPIYISQMMVSRLVSVIVLAALPASVFYSSMDKYSLTAYMATVYLIVFSINLGFILCAKLNVTCTRLSNMIWSLISAIEDQTYFKYSQSNGVLPRGHFLTQFDLRSRDFYNFQAGSMRGEFEYCSHALVNPHTLLLNRKLVVLNDITTEHFVCKLFGVLKIDYCGILRFNHWIISGYLFLHSNTL